MTYDYNEQEKTPVSITLENGVSVEVSWWTCV